MKRNNSRHTGFSRRQFLTLTAAALGAGALRGRAAVDREIRGDMAYRRLGRTDLMISEVGIGGSPPPEEALFRQAIDMGVNYVDTSPAYGRGNCERQVGAIVKDIRDDFIITGKIFANVEAGTTEGYIESVDGTLERLQTGYVDILQIHGVGSPAQYLDEKVLAAFDTLKEQGKIHFTGMTCHQDPVNVLPEAITSGHYDVITVGYHPYLDQFADAPQEDYLAASGIQGLIDLANEHDVGVIAMKTLKCEKAQDLSGFGGDGVTLAQSLLKWALSNPGISGLITEILTEQQLFEDLAVAGKPMTEEEAAVVRHYVARTSCTVCRSCVRCQAACPEGVAIADVLRFAAYDRCQGKLETARAHYRGLPRGAQASACADCGSCERACPHGVHTRKGLREAHARLA